MAATGLLGFNPYGKGVAIDFSSKPTQLAIQLEQREQAKREALDKYLMDYEKSINSAGMRKAESNIFLNKLSENKAFYIQNRDKILNPAKYGYDAQSQYMSNFKDMTNLIDQSKQAAANDKITTQHFITQKNLNAPDGYAEAVEASHLPITDPRYRQLDVTQYRFYKSHDPFEFGKELKTLNTIPGKPELMKEGNYQYQRTPMEADINNLKSFSYNKLSDVGYVKMLQNLSSEELGELRNVYRQRMNAELPKGDAKELSLAYTLTNLPKDYTQTNMVESPSFARGQQDALIRGRQKLGGVGGVVQMENLLDKTGGGGVPVKIGNSGYEIVAGKVLDKNGNRATIKFSISGGNFQPELYSVLEKYGIDLRSSKDFRVVAQDGRIESITDAKGKVVDRKTMINAQKKFDTERKGEEPLYDYGEDEEPKKVKKYKGLDKNGNPIYE